MSSCSAYFSQQSIHPHLLWSCACLYCLYLNVSRTLSFTSHHVILQRILFTVVDVSTSLVILCLFGFERVTNSVIEISRLSRHPAAHTIDSSCIHLSYDPIPVCIRMCHELYHLILTTVMSFCRAYCQLLLRGRYPPHLWSCVSSYLNVSRFLLFKHHDDDVILPHILLTVDDASISRSWDLAPLYIWICHELYHLKITTMTSFCRTYHYHTPCIYVLRDEDE